MTYLGLYHDNYVNYKSVRKKKNTFLMENIVAWAYN